MKMIERIATNSGFSSWEEMKNKALEFDVEFKIPLYFDVKNPLAEWLFVNEVVPEIKTNNLTLVFIDDRMFLSNPVKKTYKIEKE